MRYWIAAACLAASITTTAFATVADDKWRDAIRQAFDLTLECHEKQVKHAFQSQFVDEEIFVTVVKALCKKQEELLLEGMTRMLMERGVPTEEIIDKVAAFSVEMDGNLRELYRGDRNKLH